MNSPGSNSINRQTGFFIIRLEVYPADRLRDTRFPGHQTAELLPDDNLTSITIAEWRLTNPATLTVLRNPLQNEEEQGSALPLPHKKHTIPKMIAVTSSSTITKLLPLFP